MLATLRVPALIAIGTITLAGCSGGSDFFGSLGSSSSDVTTSSVAPSQAQKVDPACGNLALEIDTLRREGIADKLERAAAKKYKMTPADIAKANQLTRANASYQEKCSTLPRTAATPDPSAAPAPAPVAPAKAPAAKAAPKAPPKAAAVKPTTTAAVASADPR